MDGWKSLLFSKKFGAKKKKSVTQEKKGFTTSYLNGLTKREREVVGGVKENSVSFGEVVVIVDDGGG